MSEKIDIKIEKVEEFCIKIFKQLGVPKKRAKKVAKHLTTANLSGIDTHGIMRIPYYREGLKKGLIKPDPKIEIKKETPASAYIDGDDGMGMIVAEKATQKCIEKAKNNGIGIVGVKNLGHVGMLGYYTRKIAREKLVAIDFANSPDWVVPWGGTEKIFGTNPLSYAFPRDEDEEPIVLDIATSASSSFGLRRMAREGKEIPPGWVIDEKGNSITDPKKAREKGRLLPFDKHKGYGFSLLTELFSYPLVGGISGREMIHHAATQGGFFVQAIDPTIFRKFDEYKKDVRELVQAIKSSETWEGYDKVMLPGEIEKNTKDERKKTGIPIEKDLLEELNDLSEELDISPLSIE